MKILYGLLPALGAKTVQAIWNLYHTTVCSGYWFDSYKIECLPSRLQPCFDQFFLSILLHFELDFVLFYLRSSQLVFDFYSDLQLKFALSLRGVFGFRIFSNP